MMSWNRLPWVGAGVVVAAVISFVIGVVHYRHGKRSRSYLIWETVQDIGFVCLGVSFMFETGTQPRVWFMSGFVVLVGTYVGRRIWHYFKGNTGDPAESE
ncbi:MAG: hypothetical protein JSW50_11340 [Candidatus Latescibacterota bacterium]|nr:MAG: hypothetical protein JSW50_11340 [Candidatus Latescibacterota bacterium]